MDLQRRARTIQLAAKADWYLIKSGRFDLVGSGDVSAEDLRAVHRELGARGVFVCVAKPKPLEEVLAQKWGTKRITRSSRAPAPIGPKLRWVALGARVAVLPDLGTVWVDDEHLFKAGDTVPLPWTEPPVALVVVRPSTVLEAMRVVLGPNGPKRATLRRA